MAPKPWTHDEETALGRCYIDHSENKTKEDDGLYRSRKPYISSTMFKMEGYEPKLMRFSNIYNNCANNCKSGMNDEANEGQSSSKRTKNSETNEYSPRGSDAHTVNLKLDDEFEIQELVRPVGQDTAKRASSSSR
ncbi:hypothetical protein R6Q57_016485 [Mikania cordata]